MAWQVYDAFAPSGSYQVQYGPLPCKRWIKSPTDKPHKLSKRYGKMQSYTPDQDTKRQIDERKAKEYAYWLAKRDGIAIPETFQVSYSWDGITSEHRTRKTKRGEVAVWSPRIKAVHFRVSSSKVTTVELPNWDFDPKEPTEETLDFADELAPQIALIADALYSIRHTAELQAA